MTHKGWCVVKHQTIKQDPIFSYHNLFLDIATDEPAVPFCELKDLSKWPKEIEIVFMCPSFE